MSAIQQQQMYETNINILSDGKENDTELDEENLAKTNSRPTIHWGPVLKTDSIVKEEINTDTDHFDALFARSNASPPHPRCYSTCSPSTVPTLITTDTSPQLIAKSHPLLNSSKTKSSQEITAEPNSSPGQMSAKTKRKNFSLTHSGQTFLQATVYPHEQLEPLARSCSYKRPQSIKKYRQKKDKEKEKEQQQQQQESYFSQRNSGTVATSQANHSAFTVMSDSTRKSTTNTTPRISATELMAIDDPQDQWSSPKPTRSERLGSLPLDQLQLPVDGDEEIYLVRQFNTTSKGFVNRGDSFKRSIKRSGSNSRRNSFRTNPTLPTERTSSPENDVTITPSSTKEIRTSKNSLNNSSGGNLNGLIDNHFLETTNSSPTSMPLANEIEHGNDDEDEDEDDDSPIVEHIQTEDGRLQEVHIYQVYLLGISGTGKCSLMRQFKTTEYRGIYDYSSSVDDDPDNTVSIMLDGVESRLHIMNIDTDYSKISVTGDAYIVVYSITDRQSFQTAAQLIKNIRDNELISNQSPIKRHTPIILVGNKSDLVRKRSVTKEAARHAAIKYDCKFVETSAAINDKVDDLLAGTLKQIRINEQIRTEQKRRLTLANGSIDTNDSEMPILSNGSRKTSAIYTRHSFNVFSKFLNVFRKKPSRLSSDVENLNTIN